jgi:uncharacterized protein with HEPN domain
MTPETERRLRDALEAALLIEQNCRFQTLEGYLDDLWFRSAAERNLEIIGEAFNQARRQDPELAGLLPEIRGWIGLRNVLSHAYDDIRVQVTWDTIQQEIPVLIDTLRSLLRAQLSNE